MAEPLAGGELLDPHGGRADLDAARRADGLRPARWPRTRCASLRAVRIAVELDLELDPRRRRRGRPRTRAGSSGVAPERVFAELKRVVARRRVRARPGADGRARADRRRAARAARAAAASSRAHFHHLDVYDHTLEVARRGRASSSATPRRWASTPRSRAAGRAAGRRADPRRRRCARPRCCTTPPSRRPAACARTGRVTFIGHDARGRRSWRATSSAACAPPRTAARLRRRADRATTSASASSSTSARSTAARVWRYLRATEPVQRRRHACSPSPTASRPAAATPTQAIDAAPRARARAARRGAAPARRAGRRPLVRGDELARELGVAPGPAARARCSPQLAEDRFAGEIATREDALSARAG